MLEVRATRAPWRDDVELMLGEKDSSGTEYVFDLVRNRAEPNLLREATFALKNQAAQMLMDELWRCGLRPSEGTGSAGALAATQKHLDDMRCIAFTLLEREPAPGVLLEAGPATTDAAAVWTANRARDGGSKG